MTEYKILLGLLTEHDAWWSPAEVAVFLESEDIAEITRRLEELVHMGRVRKVSVGASKKLFRYRVSAFRR